MQITWFMYHIVDPSLGLLHSQLSPLVFRHQVGFWDIFSHLQRQNNMSSDENKRLLIVECKYLVRFDATILLDDTSYLRYDLNYNHAKCQLDLAVVMLC